MSGYHGHRAVAAEEPSVSLSLQIDTSLSARNLIKVTLVVQQDNASEINQETGTSSTEMYGSVVEQPPPPMETPDSQRADIRRFLQQIAAGRLPPRPTTQATSTAPQGPLASMMQAIAKASLANAQPDGAPAQQPTAVPNTRPAFQPACLQSGPFGQYVHEAGHPADRVGSEMAAGGSRPTGPGVPHPRQPEIEQLSQTQHYSRSIRSSVWPREVRTGAQSYTLEGDGQRPQFKTTSSSSAMAATSEQSWHRVVANEEATNCWSNALLPQHRGILVEGKAQQTALQADSPPSKFSQHPQPCTNSSHRVSQSCRMKQEEGCQALRECVKHNDGRDEGGSSAGVMCNELGSVMANVAPCPEHANGGQHANTPTSMLEMYAQKQTYALDQILRVISEMSARQQRLEDTLVAVLQRVDRLAQEFGEPLSY